MIGNSHLREEDNESNRLWTDFESRVLESLTQSNSYQRQSRLLERHCQSRNGPEIDQLGSYSPLEKDTLNCLQISSLSHFEISVRRRRVTARPYDKRIPDPAQPASSGYRECMQVTPFH